MALTAEEVKRLARECGFELAGVAAPDPLDDFDRFDAWRSEGMAGEMKYLTDYRGDMRSDPRRLLPSVQSIVCVGKLYNTPHPRSTEWAAGEATGRSEQEAAWISRYAWGEDYHDVMRAGLERLRDRIAAVHGEPFEWKICVDTAPLLERSYARRAGLGWIGKNTCLINQQQGSWFFLGELLLSVPLHPGTPPAERCGTCRRCVDACPTEALIIKENGGENGTTLDARLCISYLTIEKRGSIPEAVADKLANHVFGCDICQDVCPWNRRAPHTEDESFQPATFAPPLGALAGLSEEEFRASFRHSPVWRAKYAGFLRNVAFAIGNTGGRETRSALERLAAHQNEDVRGAAIIALRIFDQRFSQNPAEDSA